MGHVCGSARNQFQLLLPEVSLATIVLPVVRGLEKLYVPRLIGAIAVTLLLLLLIALLIVLLSAPRDTSRCEMPLIYTL